MQVPNKENHLLTAELLEALARDADELANIVVDASRFGAPGLLLRVGQVQDFKPCRLADIDDEDVKRYVSRFAPEEERQ